MKIRVAMGWLSISVAILAVAGCKNSTIGNPGIPTISTQPTNQTVTIGQTATFSVTASGTGTLTYQWFKNGVSINGATTSSYTTPATTSTDNNAFFFCYIANAVGSVESNVVTLTVNKASSSLTFHSDDARTGLNSSESILTPGNVNAGGFGKVGLFPLVGAVDAQPLYLSEVNVPGKGVRDILYVATENDTVFAFDAFSGAVLWRSNVAGSGETPGDNSGCNPASPNAGISATPVIDRTQGLNGAIYLVAKSRDAAGNSFERLHALDVSTGTELFGGPTTIPVSLSGGAQAFEAASLRAQGGMLASNGHVYASWGAPCASTASAASTGNDAWVVAFDSGNLAVTGALNIGPAGTQGGTVVNGETLAADATGRLFIGGIGSIQPSALSSFARQQISDTSIAGGPVLLLPDATDQMGKVWHLAVNAAADGNIYLLDRDAQSSSGTASNGVATGVVAGIVQRLDGISPSGAAPAGLAYFNNTVYVAAAGGVRAFTVTNARLSAAPTSQSSGTFGPAGASVSVSAQSSAPGSANGIVWVFEGGDAGVLHAYDAADLSAELFNSKQAQNGRDDFGPGNASAMPLVVNGRVYVVTANGVAVFGLLK
jgi:hypothetical protein